MTAIYSCNLVKVFKYSLKKMLSKLWALWSVVKYLMQIGNRKHSSTIHTDIYA